MKKILTMLLATLLVFSMVGCGSGEGKEDEIKIGVIHIGDPADGSGYSFAHDEEIKAMQENLGLMMISSKKMNVDDSDNSASRKQLKHVSEKGVMYFCTAMDMDTMEQWQRISDVIFSHGTGYKSNDTNFNNYFGRIYQARYLAGVAAGLKTQSDKIGYVAAYGTELAETCSGINAFALGVQSVNPDAVVYVKTLNSWFDPANETAYAEALIEMGCDVIAQHCDTENPQVAAENAGGWGCGYNSDMTEAAPAAHLTAPIWNWGVYYTAAVEAVMNDEWASFGNYYAGIKEGFVDISPLSDNCVEGTAEKIDAVKALFNEGSWDVVSGVKLSFNEDNSVVMTDADLLKDDGSVIVPAGGESVEDSVITGTMNYFVKGVELK